MPFRPGRRPSPGAGKGGRGKFGRGGGRDEDESSGFPRMWDLRITTRLQRCILSHDLEHILNWHTPAYTVFVYFSILIIVAGAAEFGSIWTYLSLLLASAIVVGGTAKSLQVESGPHAVVAPTDLKVRSRTTVEGNLRSMYEKWVEPSLKLFCDKVNVSNEGGGGGIKMVALFFVLVSLLAEAGKFVSFSQMLCLGVTLVFIGTGIKKFLKTPAASTSVASEDVSATSATTAASS